MKKTLNQLLCLAAFAGIAMPACGLTIVPTFDSSITGDPNGAAMMNAINAAVQVVESNILDNVIVNITFKADESVGLGESSTFGTDVSYASFLSALQTHANSANDTNALSTLPNSSTDPVIGGSQIHLTTPQGRLLGLINHNGTDSTIKLKMSLMNLTRPPTDPNKYDLEQVTEHEMDEVLGISSALPNTSIVWPVDLFRYTTNLVRTFTTSGDDAYFSIDGVHLLARYNMDSGGDYGDWWSYNFPTNWSPITGLTLNYPQVQDAFSGPGNAMDLGAAELTALDVVGWTLAATTTSAPRPTLAIVRSGASQYTLSWSNSFTGFVLQERTNLISGSWANSASGSANPAVIVSTDALKFYRLFQPLAPLVKTSAPATQTSSTNGLYLVTRAYHPYTH